MDFSLAVKNIVIVGEFNPAFFDKYFFIKNNIVEEGSILDSSHFLSEVCILSTSEFNLTIVTNQLVFTDLSPVTNINSAVEIVKKVCSLGTFPSTAIGINFHWYLFSEERTAELSKKYFHNEKELLTKTFFNENNVSYGLYLSKDFRFSRLKLDIKPATVTKIGSETEQRVIAFIFNFHCDIKEEPTKVFSVLSEGQEYYDEAKKIIDVYGI